MNTVYDRIQTMTKDELQKLILCIYNLGHIDQQHNVSESMYLESLLDLYEDSIDQLFDRYAQYQPVSIRVIASKDGGITYIRYRFYDINEAAKYLDDNLPNLVKINDTTYATQYAMYKLCDLRGGDTYEHH